MSSPEAVERVFPIRLSIFENSPFLQHSSGIEPHSVVPVQAKAEGSPDGEPLTQPESEVTTDPQSTAPVPSASELSPETNDTGTQPEPHTSLTSVPPTSEVEIKDASTGRPGQKVSNKFQYAVLSGGSHGVLHGTQRKFTRCEDELIHIPGAIQSHGILVALKRQSESVFVPRIVSENSVLICNYQPSQVLALSNFTQIVPTYLRVLFVARLDKVRREYNSTGRSSEPVVFEFSFIDPEGLIIPCWCAAHYLGSDLDLYVCEFELQDTSMHPMAHYYETERTNYPVNTLGSDHMDLATVSSLQSRSQPLLMDSDKEGGFPNLSSIEVISITTKIQKQFSEAKSVPELLESVVGAVKELSRFGRVMIYQFDEIYNGTVVAELMDPNESVDVYRGLHFPHTDIPPQARELYMINKVRVLFDRAQPTARLVGRDPSDVEIPLDLTHSYLRALSPVHLKYLANMGVRSSMSMSLSVDKKLWGLIVCHSYGATATRVPFTVRELAYFVGNSASTCLEKLLVADQVQARKIIETLEGQQNPNECITASSDELLQLFEADCGFLVVEGEARTIGRLSAYAEAVTLLKYLFFRRSSSVLSSSDIAQSFPDLHYPSGFKTIAGVMYIPLSGKTDDCVVFYRRSQIREVHWAGKPSFIGKIGTLEPRNSFQKWTEVVLGTSKAWTPEHLHLATMAQLVYGSFIRVWREKEMALRETRIKRLLLHDASHQVRTPLNAVINYLEMALEKQLEESIKDTLVSSYNASKSLIYVIDDLLNLTGNTTGSIPQVSNPFDVGVCLEEALEPLNRLAREKGIEVVLRASAVVTRYLRGDPSALQRAVSVLVANAIEHTTSGRVVVEWTEMFKKTDRCTMHISVRDSGPGLSERALDDMFQEFEQVPDEDFDEMMGYSFPPREDVLRVGVGLAFVARYVKQRDGQLRVRSIKDHGSTFTLEVPFDVASRAPSIALRRDASPLPALPMPNRPGIQSGRPQENIMTPSGSSGAGPAPKAGVSATIIAPTPNISPMDTARTPASMSFTVLIADDNQINIRILDKRLRTLGHKVLVSRDGSQCYQMFQENQATCDFVLMDLNMPGVDGMESLRKIREIEHQNPTPSRTVQSCGRVPVFVVSGMLRREDEQKYKDAGFDGWMPKPIDMRKLNTYLAGAMDLAARRLGLYDESHFALGGWFSQDIATSMPCSPLSPRHEYGVASPERLPTAIDDVVMNGSLKRAPDSFFPAVNWGQGITTEVHRDCSADFPVGVVLQPSQEYHKSTTIPNIETVLESIQERATTPDTEVMPAAAAAATGFSTRSHAQTPAARPSFEVDPFFAEYQSQPEVSSPARTI
ncbi:putative signal transduction histidine-protein kinase [Podospora australis]|uniref:Signal transduction histidine-protein kinase n=1 Tax=Podospora australis TaxID=1536484 RepID=A0AAN6WTG9_9PEZI|nr:putative signal transduction histidine-protein kinase [Podospora australis]